MAILRNIISSGSRKSAGQATFRMVRGRTIMSQKRGPSPAHMETRAAAGLVMTRREAIFALSQVLMQALAADIEAAFSKTQYGSARNHFMKVNYNFLAQLFGTNVTDDDYFTNTFSSLLPNIGTSILNCAMVEEGFIGRFKAWCAASYSGATTRAMFLFNAQGWGGLVSQYVRADIDGRLEIATTEGSWPTFTAVIPSVETMLVNLHSAAAGSVSNYIESVACTGRNLSSLSNAVVKVGSTTLAGTWANGVFTPTGASSHTFTGSEIVSVTYAGTILVSQQVQFTSGNSAGGE